MSSQLPGKIYEVALFVQTLINNQDKKFDLGREIKLGDKFDDLVVRVNDNEYTLVQIKLVDNNTDLIDSKVLLGEKRISLKNDDFKLQKYFLSYLRIKDQLNSRDNNSIIKKLIIYTNASLNVNDIKKEVGNIKDMKNSNDIISSSSEKSESYKITKLNQVFIGKIKRYLKSDLQILAEILAAYVINCNSNQNCMVLDKGSLSYYQLAIIVENVIEVTECQQGTKEVKVGMFTQNFIDGNELSHRAQALREKVLETVLKKHNIHTALKNMRKTTWKLSDDFCSTQSKDVIFLPDYEISDTSVKDFFGVLELKVNQLGVKDLMMKIKNVEIKERFLEYYDTDPKLIEFLINDFIKEWRIKENTQEQWLLNEKRTEFLKKLHSKIAKPQAEHKTQKHIKYIENIMNKNDLRFHDGCLFNGNHFTGKKIILISTASIILTSVKIVQYLTNTMHKKHIFLDLESLSQKKEVVKLIDAFRAKDINLLIISYKSLKDNDLINDLFKKLSVIVRVNNKQLIIITLTADTLIKKFESFKEFRDKTIGAEHLVNSSKILLKEITIQNQTKRLCDFNISLEQIDGLTVERLTFNKITIGSNILEMNYLVGAHSELFEKVNKNVLTDELLIQKSDCIYIISGIPGCNKADKLLKELGIKERSKVDIVKRQIEVLDNLEETNRRIKVCDDKFNERDFKKVCVNNAERKIVWLYLENLNNVQSFILAQVYNPKFYIQGQRFNKEVVIERSIKEHLGYSQLSERFLIIAKNKMHFKTWLQFEDTHDESFEIHLRNGYIYLFNPLHSSDKEVEDMFIKIMEKNKNETVHLLKFENDKLIWCKTHGSLKILCKYRSRDYKKTQSLMTEVDIIRQIKDKRVVIISGEPGIGKTTSLVKLCATKYRLETNLEDSLIISHWVVKINLKNNLPSIRDINFSLGDIKKEVIKFLSQVDKNFDDDVAKTLLIAALSNKDFGKPLLIVFDGFDEVLDEEDRDKIIFLLKYLQHTSVKFWITTRMHFEETVESELSQFAIRLEAMSAEQIRMFIKTYLKDSLRLILSHKEYVRIFGDDTVRDTNTIQEYTTIFLSKMQEIYIGDVSMFIGTPLQLYLMLDGSARYFKEWVVNNKQHLDLSYLGDSVWDVYTTFIERKYHNFFAKSHVKEDTKQKQIKIVSEYFHRDIAKSLILKSEVKKFLAELKDLVLSVGVIRSDGKNIEFIHTTFKEFFAAKVFIYWIKKWTTKSSNVLTHSEKKKYLFQVILTESNFKFIRVFLNAKLLQDKFEGIQFDEQYYNDGILFQAVNENNFGIAEFVISNFKNVDVNTRLDWTLYGGVSHLKNATSSGNLDMLKLFLKYSNANNLIGLYSSLLFYAVGSGNLEIVKFLVENGADVNCKDSLGRPLLQIETSLEICKFLIDNGANVNAQNDSISYSVLSSATTFGHFDLVKLLVENGADVNSRDIYGRTVLHCSVDDFEMFKFLEQKGADINIVEDGYTVLHGAATFGNKQLVEYLVNKGMNVKDETEIGMSVLHHAVKSGNLETVKYLVENGADVNSITKDGLTVLTNVFNTVSDSEDVNQNIIKYLVENGVHINATDENNRSALHLAVLHDRQDIVIYLLSQNIDVTRKSKDGKTALDIARIMNRKDIIDILKNN